jgi:hypothetical protein
VQALAPQSCGSTAIVRARAQAAASTWQRLQMHVTLEVESAEPRFFESNIIAL